MSNRASFMRNPTIASHGREPEETQAKPKLADVRQQREGRSNPTHDGMAPA
jgi:hypothetical protein